MGKWSHHEKSVRYSPEDGTARQALPPALPRIERRHEPESCQWGTDLMATLPFRNCSIDPLRAAGQQRAQRCGLRARLLRQRSVAGFGRQAARGELGGQLLG